MAWGDSNWAGFPWAGIGPEGLGTPITPDAPGNIVENVAEGLRGRLGCGDPAVFISFRCGATVCAIPTEAIVELSYDRRLNEISEANLEIAVTGDAFSACCECLAEVEPWCHELHIWRDGAEQWVGPIQTITYTYESVKIFAKDVLAWTEVFVPPINIDYMLNPLGYDLAEIAQDVVEQAYAENEFACELNYLQVETDPTNIFTRRFFPAFTGTSFDFLDALADTGVFYTTIGRTIFIAAPLDGNIFGLTRLALLTDEHIMGNLEVRKDGELQGNRFFVHWDGDLGVPEIADATEKYCAGPIDRLVDGGGIADEDSAQQAADSYLAAQSIAPRILEIPPGSRLAPETPVELGKMVPGAIFDVSVTKMCVAITRSFRLQRVEVAYSPDDGEEVLVTLEPLNLPEGA